MIREFRYIGAIACTLMLLVGGAFAQGAVDEDRLLATEELSLTDAVQGSLPAADPVASDDFLSELLAGDGDTKGADSAATGADAALPKSLDDVVEGVAATPAADIDAFPLDAGFNADAVVGEMMDMGNTDATVEAGVDKPAADTPANLDAMLGEMVAEEPNGVAATVEEKGAPAADTSLDDLFGAETPAVAEPAVAATVEEPVAPAADTSLDDLFGTETPAVAVEPVPGAADNTLDALVGELATEAEAGLGTVVIPGGGEVSALPDMTDVAGETQKAPDADSMALDDDIFKELASEGKDDMRSTPAAITGEKQASEVAVDPFVDAGLPAGSDGPPPKAPVTAPGAKNELLSMDAFIINEEPVGGAAQAVSAGKTASSAGIPEGTAAFEEAERLKRIAREHHAISVLEAAQNALREKDYPRAIRLYEEALKHIPRRPDMEPTMARARKGFGSAYYLQSLSLERMGTKEDLENAKIAANNAVKYGYMRAEEAVARIQRKIESPPPPPPGPPKYRWREEDYLRTQSQIKAWLKKGREAYLTGEYELAILAFESVLARDPENKEAIRLMHSAANKQYDRSNAELDATTARMMASVRDTWNPRQYGLHEVPIDARVGTETVRQDDEIQRMALLDKMDKIHIPEINFRQANIRDVISFLQSQSVEADPDPVRANRRGVNIILKLDADPKAGGPAAAAPATDFFAAAPAGGDAGAGGAETLVTFTALDLTLKEALDAVVDYAGLKYLIRGNLVMVLPKNAAVGDIEHRMYDVLPSAITRLQELSSAVTAGRGNQRGGDFLAIEGNAGAGGEEVDLKGFFQEMGVEWPDKSSIKFVRGLGKLVVANTLENLTVFEKVLSILNVVPYQIEIEARFIEVAQTDVDSLGLEWLLNDNWEIAEKKTSAGDPLGSRERIQMNANIGTGGFTTGNRYLSADGITGPTAGTVMMDQIASLSGVLTNPELTVILHALQQRGHTDLLSAPKITTQSAQPATIKVVTEYIYPTEFETSGIGGNNNNNNAGGNNNGGGSVGAVVTPREFRTREVGVILQVTPEVSPEGQMINLALEPEVVSEPTWKNYGSTYTSYDPNGNPVVQTLNMEQPFFHTRKLKTNLLIYNGATVVMGGMITEVRSNVDDKIPILGDIPLIGRLFRSKYESSEKRNLLIFVTARLVDPSGRALDRERFGVDKSIAERIVATENTPK